jgi:ferredoxin
MKVRVDRDLCRGLGNCVVLAPTVFRLDEANKALVTDPNSVDEGRLFEAAETCSENAIILEDDGGRQLYP